MTSPPSSRTAIANVMRVRSDGFSNSSATCLPASGVRATAAGPAARSRFERRRERRAACSSSHVASDRGPTESPWRASMSATRVELGCVAHVRYSALIRTYSALKSHVHIVASCAAAGAEIDRDRHLCRPAALSAAASARSSCGTPRTNSRTSPIATDARRARTPRPIGRRPR